jgi:predicted nucleotidyltransferase
MVVIDEFSRELRAWSTKQPEIQGVAIVGSWARGTARPDSDIDVIMITTKPEKLLEHQEWLSQFGTAERIVREDWGLVQSLRVFYVDGKEVEFGITTSAWTSEEEIGQGTGRVINDGVHVVFDPHSTLQELVRSAQAWGAGNQSL